MQLGYSCMSHVAKFASGIVTYCAFAGNKCKKRIKRSKESFFMELNFKSNVRIVLSFSRNLLADAQSVALLGSERQKLWLL
jgi:hypothetical protein